jgi:TetR/AcrR family transcriptional repressor of nem operon
MNKKYDINKTLEIGLQLFSSQGYTHLGVDAICKKTGMTKGAFYNAFASKENFLLSCLDFYSKNNIKRISKKLTPKENIPAIDRLQIFYFEMLELLAERKYCGCILNNMMSELAGNNARVRDAINLYFENMLDVIEPTIVDAQAEKTIRGDIDSKIITELIHSSFFWVITRAKSLQDVTNGKDAMKLLIHSLSP